MTEATAPKRRPRRRQMTEHQQCSQIEGEAMQLQAQLASANGTKIRSIIRQLAGLAAQVPAHGKCARRVAAIIAAVIAQAQCMEDSGEESGKRHLSEDERQLIFEAQVYQHMSPEAQHFYDAMDSDAHYILTPVAAGGHVWMGQGVKVEGADLRKAFATLKYHSLKEAHQSDIIENPAATASVHESLAAMEAYKASQILTEHAGHLPRAMAKIRYNHTLFAKAKEQWLEVVAHHAKLAHHPEDNLAKAALGYAKDRMATVLREDVINKAILELHPEHGVISAGLHVTEALPVMAIMAVYAAAHTHTARPATC